MNTKRTRHYTEFIASEADETYTRAIRKYAVSYMSDSKWRKLFLAVAEAGIKIEKTEWRFIWTDRVFDSGWPVTQSIDRARTWSTSLGDTRYRDIESIFVPRTYYPHEHVGYVRHQDVDGLLKVLRGIGEFVIEEMPEGIAILGYGRSRSDTIHIRPLHAGESR